MTYGYMQFQIKHGMTHLLFLFIVFKSKCMNFQKKT